MQNEEQHVESRISRSPLTHDYHSYTGKRYEYILRTVPNSISFSYKYYYDAWFRPMMCSPCFHCRLCFRFFVCFLSVWGKNGCNIGREFGNIRIYYSSLRIDGYITIILTDRITVKSVSENVNIWY